VVSIKSTRIIENVDEHATKDQGRDDVVENRQILVFIIAGFAFGQGEVAHFLEPYGFARHPSEQASVGDVSCYQSR
jgi:hypothetical protein